MRFASVGLIATLVHGVCYIGLIQFSAVGIILANIFSFIIAFGFSWAGHQHWTFRSESKRKLQTALRFFFVAILGLLSNIFFTTVLVQSFSLPKEVGIVPILFVTPPLTYLISKLWVFRLK